MRVTGRICAFSFFLLIFVGSATAADWQYPPLPPKAEYGNILMNRLSEKNGQKAVIFSHWSHRMRHTCRVCHLELEFEMRLDTTEITEEQNRAGRFCGACHDGKKVFGHSRKGDCAKCHNGDIAAGTEKFKELASFPKAPFGNQIDWVAALRAGLINPVLSIFEEKYVPMPFKKKLILDAEQTMIAPADFEHTVHSQWLDCANCHPDIFNVKKKTTKHFSMDYILKGKFCGACHRTVAFPINDCNPCHPGLKR